MHHPALILANQPLTIVNMAQQLAKFADTIGNSDMAKMLCSAAILIAQHLPKYHKVGKETEQYFIHIFGKSTDPPPE
ncbi:hypothetical protein I4U23_011253 [Adineta vaga]|nr:hypothetical protein I4U23_011253 [Adineta vaga]